jgi:hypothetical protein
MCSAEHLNVTYISPPYVQSSHLFLVSEENIVLTVLLMFYYTPSCFDVGSKVFVFIRGTAPLGHFLP